VPEAGGAHVGDGAWGWAFLVLLALALVAYLVGLRLLAGRARLVRPVVAIALAVQLAPLGAPLLLSTDAWTYWGYGRIAVAHDGNPYRDTLSDFPDDPALQWAGDEWRDSTSVYGPGFTLASEPLAALADESETIAAWLYKVLAALAAAALVLVAARAGAFAAAFVGWNPVLAVHLAGGGHNDAWVGALVVTALTAAAVGRRQVAGVAWVLGAAVKWVPLVLLPLRALEARETGRAVGQLGLAVAAVAAAGLATWRYGFAWLGAFGPLAENAGEMTSFALPHRLTQLGVPDAAAIGVFAALFLLAYAWLVREAWRGRARVALAAALLLLCTPYVAPWYLAWVVPLAALEEDRLARGLALGLTAYLLPQAIPV
jgi:hypothetical protein